MKEKKRKKKQERIKEWKSRKRQKKLDTTNKAKAKQNKTGKRKERKISYKRSFNKLTRIFFLSSGGKADPAETEGRGEE